MLGQIIPFDLTGIDFCMTALFVTIFIDQWETAKTHTPALAGLCVAVLALAIFGANGFMLPALLATSGILILRAERRCRREYGKIFACGSGIVFLHVFPAGAAVSGCFPA